MKTISLLIIGLLALMSFVSADTLRVSADIIKVGDVTPKMSCYVCNILTGECKNVCEEKAVTSSRNSGHSSQYGLFKRYLRNEHKDIWDSCLIKKPDGYISNKLKRQCLRELWAEHRWNWRENKRI